MVQDKGVAFGMEGPIMTGTWVNPNTGHKFTVRDCFFQDNQFMVQTTDGQVLDYNTIQNYVQCTDSQGKEMDYTPVKSKTDIPAEVASLISEDSTDDGILPEDRLLMKGLGNINDRSTSSPMGPAGPVGPKGTSGSASPDRLMVERVLRKFPRPEIEANILWETPERQIDTLINVLGIEPETIAEYYTDYLSPEAILEVVKTKLSEYISQIANNVEVTPTVPTTSTTPPTQEPTKPTTKKTRQSRK